MTGGQASSVFGETLCLPAGRQGGTFPRLTAETKILGSDLAASQARLLIRLKTRRAGVRRRPHWSGRHPRRNPYLGGRRLTNRAAIIMMTLYSYLKKESD